MMPATLTYNTLNRHRLKVSKAETGNGNITGWRPRIALLKVSIQTDVAEIIRAYLSLLVLAYDPCFRTPIRLQLTYTKYFVAHF
jgi:hypothetical protein